LNEGAFLTGARYSEILIFFVCFSFLPQNISINKIYAKAISVFSLFFAMMLLPTMMVLGIDYAKNSFNAYFAYTAQVHAYDFIQRVQSLNTLAWFPGILLKLSNYGFMASHTLAGAFGTKTHKPFVLPVTLISLGICMIPVMRKESVIMLLASDRVFPFIILPFTFGLPFLLVLIYFFRRKKINPLLEQIKSGAQQSG
jgi:hypothetical protein